MSVQKLKNSLQLLLNTIIFVVIACFILFSLVQKLEAAVAPNQQNDKCGPYYIWYQIGPDSYTHPADYIDLYGITFDISDIVDDFDFVYFTDTRTLQRASLDKNRDGASDRHFFRINGNQLEWSPINGRVRITQRGCWGSVFNENCGYAMISIQPKPGFHNGSARIPIMVTKKCSPSGFDCSETHLVFHEYSDCFPESLALPEFSIQKISEIYTITTDEYTINYSVIVQNTGDKKNKTILTDSITKGSKGGTLVLGSLSIECPKQATCTILNVTNDRIKISLTDVPVNEKVIVSYVATADRNEIPKDEYSYFTNTATLSTGGSVRITEGVSGIGTDEQSGDPERRQEHPRE